MLCVENTLDYEDKNGKQKIDTVSEISAYPLGFLLYFSPKEDISHICFDITSFADCEPDETCALDMVLPIYECNSVFPTDFRSKDEIQTTVK